MKSYDVREYSQDTWQDFEALFGKHKGVRGGCWCTFNLCTSSQFDKMTKDERKELQYNLAHQGLASGLLVFDEGVPIAWCQFGPAERFPRFDRMRAYQELQIPAEFSPNWRIACIFVDKHRRKEGLSRYAFHAALEIIHQRGGGIVEAFPLDVAGITRPQYTGSVKMYTQAGFQEVTRLGKNTVLMRLEI